MSAKPAKKTPEPWLHPIGSHRNLDQDNPLTGFILFLKHELKISVLCYRYFYFNIFYLLCALSFLVFCCLDHLYDVVLLYHYTFWFREWDNVPLPHSARFSFVLSCGSKVCTWIQFEKFESTLNTLYPVFQHATLPTLQKHHRFCCFILDQQSLKQHLFNAMEKIAKGMCLVS